jgi:uncharacterized protein
MHEQSTDGIIGPFVKRNQKVVIIPGNHESVATADFLAEVYDVTNLHGYSIRMKDVGFFGCGGAPNVGPAPTVSEKEITELLQKSYNRIKDLKTKVMVTHVHPAGTLAEKLPHEILQPSTAVTSALKKFKPDLLVCSHVHEAEGLEERAGNTRIIHVGRKGKLIEL